MMVASPVTGTPAVGDSVAAGGSVAVAGSVARGVSVTDSVGSIVGSVVGVVAGPQAVRRRATKSIAPNKVWYFILSHSFQAGRFLQLYRQSAPHSMGNVPVLWKNTRPLLIK